MMNKSNCLICGSPLVYSDESEELACYYCKETKVTNGKCANGHYVCDACHALGAYDIIKKYCLETDLTNPILMAEALMKHPAIKMHGPEHHFLIAAVLITAYYNKLEQPEKIAKNLDEAAKRAKNILGGFCGFYGNCGAAVGTGIFISIITGSNPLSHQEWQLANLMTATSLKEIAEHGGPRCCKRNSFLAITEAVKFTQARLGVELADQPQIQCQFHQYNEQCLKNNCKFF